jgi:superfamily I DNA/RNA helicase
LETGSDLKQFYDVILIDEAQDFAPVWFKVIKAVLKPGGSLLICDDPTQSIFRYYSWRQKGIEVVGHTRTLHVPFRNTREISVAAHTLIQCDTTLKQSDDVPVPNLKQHSLRCGEVPQLVKCEDRASEILFVEAQVAQFLHAGMAADDIAVLCQTSAHVKQWGTLTVQKVYVNTFAKMKGLEFRAVIVPHLNYLFDGEEVDAEFVTYHGELPAQIDVLRGVTIVR